MQNLKSERLNHLSARLLKVLAQNRITTLLDFIQEDVTKLATLTKLSLSEILAIRNEIFTKYSAPLLNGATLYTKVVNSRSVISTGKESLDAIIDGGIPVRYITEICGLAGSGKTQLALLLAINCVKDETNTVLYINTKGDFSAVRVQKMLEARRYSHKDMAVLMYKIRVVHIWTMEDLVDLFKSLKNRTLQIKNLAFLIVDSLPCLMFQYLGGENKMGLSLLNTLVNYCRFVVNEFNAGIIFINIQTRWIDTEISDKEDGERSSIIKEPAACIEKRNRCLGRYWEHIPSLVLQLDKLEDNSKENCIKIKVTVISSNNVKNVNSQCVLNLNAAGVT